MKQITELELIQIQILSNQMELAKILKLLTMQFPKLGTEVDFYLQNMVDKTNLTLDRINGVSE